MYPKYTFDEFSQQNTRVYPAPRSRRNIKSPEVPPVAPFQLLPHLKDDLNLISNSTTMFHLIFLVHLSELILCLVSFCQHCICKIYQFCCVVTEGAFFIIA